MPRVRACALLVVPALLALTVAVPAAAAPAAPQAHPVRPALRSIAVPPGDGPQLVQQLAGGTTDRFDLVSVSWRGPADLPVAVTARIRTHGQWGPWRSLGLFDSAPAAQESRGAAARGATEPLYAGPAGGVQVRVDPPDGRRPADLRVDLIDPGRSPADATAAASARSDHPLAATDDGRPPIVSRAAWGADESIRGTCEANGAPRSGFVHHDAGSNSYSPAGAAAQLRADYAYHVLSLGWCDLGYEYVVDKFGTIYEGRAGGIDAEILGAHAGGFNTDTFGVAALGNYDLVTPSPALIDGLARILGWKLGRYGRDVHGTTVLTSTGGGTSKYPPGVQVTIPVIAGHRDTGYTDCPGDYLYPQLPRIRDLAAPVAAATPVKPPSQSTVDVVRAMYSDLLGRPADPGGLDFWSASLNRGDTGAADVALALLRSPEGTGREVTRLYRQALHRAPDRAGLAGWSAALQADPTRYPTVVTALYASDERYAASGGTDRAWLTGLYRGLLGRAPDPAGRDDWLRQLPSLGRAAVAATFEDSQEHREQRVDAIYRDLLGRPADPGGLSAYAPALLTGGDLLLTAQIAASPEYRARAQTR